MKTLVCLLASFGSLAVVACGSGGETPLGAAGFSASSGSGGAPVNQGGSTPNAGMQSVAGNMASAAQATAGGGAGVGGTNGGSPSGGQPNPPGIYAPGSCSEANLRTAPPAGKEMFKAAPLDVKFPFTEHWVGEWIVDTEASRIGMQTLADLDDDGDLDFASGQRQVLPGGMLAVSSFGLVTSR